MPRPLPPVSRRRILLGAAALAVLGTAATACGKPVPRPDVDALVAQLERARSDNQLAAAAATAAPSQIAATLTTVAAERAAHAQALSDELTRMLGPSSTGWSTSTSATSSAPTTATTTSGPPPKPPSPKDVVAALRQSADGAAQVAAQQSGYRAGLLGSISAACTAAYAVGLGAPDS
ncbi:MULTISPECIES: hypothetical protein [unclassified Mycobacterium]|uniref:hypothetical protein n=1 Tax=unclassified Mycobacterium TaxID=2642494 RepID=UPI0029C71523|nr:MULTISPECIES: hypothetical protein [unclassified Mycobacterium]